MLDVLVVAVVVATMKSSGGWIEMSTTNGLIYFTFSVILCMVVAAFLHLMHNSTAKNEAGKT